MQVPYFNFSVMWSYTYYRALIPLFTVPIIISMFQRLPCAVYRKQQLIGEHIFFGFKSFMCLEMTSTREDYYDPKRTD